MVRLLVLLACLALAAIGAAGWFFSSSPEVELTLLVTGILQGNIEPFTVAVKETGRDELRGGLAFLKGRADALRATARAAGGEALLVSVGDDLPGTSQSFYTQGRSVVEAMNLLSLDAWSVGNREFDFGPALLEKRIAEATFPAVSANVLSADGTRKPFLAPYLLRDLPGLRVGITGMAPPTTPEESKPANIAGYRFEDEAYVADRIVPEMRGKGADVVIVLTQRDVAKEMAYLERLSCAVDLCVALDYYHAATQAVRVGRMLVVPYFGLSKGEELTRVRLRIDKATKRIEAGTPEFVRIAPGLHPPDDAAARLIAESARRIDKIKGRVIGRAAVKLVRPYDNTTNLGNFVCDLMREAASAEVAIQNSGSFRADIPAGEITAGMIYDVLPFDNDLVALDLPGADLLALFEKTVAERRGLLQISGGSYRCLETAPKQWRLAALEVGGAPVDPARVYRVATNDFMAGGGGGYERLRAGTNRAELGRLRELVARGVERLGTVGGTEEARLLVERGAP